MFNKITTYFKENQDVFLHGIIGAASALAGYYYIKLKFSEEMFNQVEKSVEALGMTEVLVDHMENHVYPKK